MSRFESIVLVGGSLLLAIVLFVSISINSDNQVNTRQRPLCKQMCEVGKTEIRTFDTNTCICK